MMVRTGFQRFRALKNAKIERGKGAKKQQLPHSEMSKKGWAGSSKTQLRLI
jgi:hypothetical protein